MNYLYKGGIGPGCLEYGDADANGKLDISDSVILLKYLFQGGEVPRGWISAGVDDPPQLEFLFVKEDSITELTKFPITLSVADTTGESDIMECSISASQIDENDNPVRNEISIFQSEWVFDENDPLRGNDITTIPLEFVIEENELEERKYYLNVKCRDRAGQEVATKIKIEIKKDNRQPLFCEYGDRWSDRCCKDLNGDRDNNNYCIADLDRAGFYEPPQCDAGDREADISECCFPSPREECYQPVNEVEPLKTEKTTGNNFIALEDDKTTGSSNYPNPSNEGSNCYVKHMEILRDPEDPVPEGFELPKPYLTEAEQSQVKETFGDFTFTLPFAPDVNNNYNKPLGENEGWLKGTDISKHLTLGIPLKYVLDLLGSYFVGYGFLVVATLEEGSNPEKCFETQFATLRLTQNLPGNVKGITGKDERGMLLVESSRKISVFMDEERDILTRDIRELYTTDADTISAFGYDQSYPISVTLKDNTEFSASASGLPPKSDFCFPKTEVWCSDNYLKPRFVNFFGIGFDIKKYLRGSNGRLPKIGWWDNPSMLISLDSFLEKGQVLGEFVIPPVISPIIPEWIFKERESDFISIVEDSNYRIDSKGIEYKYRFLCSLNGWKMENNYDGISILGVNPARPTFKRVKQTRPDCSCIRQKKIYGGQWEEDKSFEKIIC